jgi:RNA polymerase sigma-70 factor (ECF subfamily)
LFRAKEKLRNENIQLIPIDNTLPDGELENRLDNVLHIIYLLFNEGYYSQTENTILRKDCCIEAMRLGVMLTEYERTNRPKTNALLALMCFHASRFNARVDHNDAQVLYEQQDTALWDTALITQGLHFLNNAATGNLVTSYHLEAGIAYWHCIKEDTIEKWTNILLLYDQLLLINYSPGVALNRIVALYKAKGREPALAEAAKLSTNNSHFYFMLMGELYNGFDNQQALAYYEQALMLAKTQREKLGIQSTIDSVSGKK